MKKTLLITLFLFQISLIHSQVGIGTTTPEAALDLKSTTNGLLIPRVALTSKDIALPVVNPNGGAIANATLIYNTATDGIAPNDVVPGFYSWDSSTSSWIPIAGTTTFSNAWDLNGNINTSPTTNFIGTIDDQDLVFKRASQQSGIISYSNIGFGTGSLISMTLGQSNAAFGHYSLSSNTIGNHNAAFGNTALMANTEGYQNSAFGSEALSMNTTGFFNNAFGTGSLSLNLTGESNTAIGEHAQAYNQTGNANTSLGNYSLFQNNSGNGNTILGNESFYNCLTGDYNVGIGYQAGYFETGSNKLYIENSNADAVNALVYGEFDNKIFRVNGGLQIGNPLGIGYNFPLSRGTIGQTLQTDASGNVTWQTPSSGGSAWNLTGNTGTNSLTNFIGTTDNQDLIFKRFNIKSGLLGTTNSSFGVSSLNAITTGINNTAIGVSSLGSTTTGSWNTASGYKCLFLNTSGFANTAIGNTALYSNTIGQHNTGIGVNSLYFNTTGTTNTATGSNSLYSNSTGSGNSANGFSSLNANTIGNFNSAFGSNSLNLNTTGSSNVSIGALSLYSNTIGSYNTANGQNALFYNLTGNNNIALGYGSLYSNSVGTGNIAIGYQSGYNELGNNKLYIENSNADAVNALVYGEFDTNIFRINGKLQIGNPLTTGYNFPLARGTNGQILQTDATGNVTWQTPSASGGGWGLTGNGGTTAATNFIGTTDNNDLVFKRFNVKSGQIGTSNTSIGVNTFAAAGFAGTNDTAIGGSALYFNTIGTNNTAIGSASLYANTSGGYNTAIGNNSLPANDTGIQNVAVGYTALNISTNGNQNAAFGTAALSSLGVNCYNNIGIGFNAQVPTNINGSNQVRIGDTNITYAGIQVPWTTTSDRRWKSDIKDMDLGLNFISKLHPVSYVRNNDSKKSVEFGLIAQELEETLNDFNIKNAGITSKDDAGFYGVRYNDLLAPMIKSIQELKTANDELKAKNETLEKRLQAIEEKLK